MGHLDRVELEFTSDVPSIVREAIYNAIVDTVRDGPITLWAYEAVSRTNGAARIEITAHDRTTYDLTDGQVIERLRETARTQGMSVQSLLRKLATE